MATLAILGPHGGEGDIRTPAKERNMNLRVTSRWLNVTRRAFKAKVRAHQRIAGVLIMVETRRVEGLTHALPGTCGMTGRTIRTKFALVCVLVTCRTCREFCPGKLLVWPGARMAVYARDLLV